jgi:hypothetical protein
MCEGSYTDNKHSLLQVTLQRTTSCSEIDLEDAYDDGALLLKLSSLMGGVIIDRPSPIAMHSLTRDGTVSGTEPRVLRGGGKRPSDGFLMEGTLV